MAGPLIISYFLLARSSPFLLDVPLQQPSSWIFRLLVGETAGPSIFRGVRRVMFEFGILAWLLATVPLNVLLLGTVMGLAHSVFCLFVSLIFLEALFFRYGRVPFTSVFDPQSTNVGIAYLLMVFAVPGLRVWLDCHGGNAAPNARLVCFLARVAIRRLAALIHARERYTEPGKPWSSAMGPPAVVTLDLQGK